MPKKLTTNVYLILDASGSMLGRRTNTINAVNKYLDDLKADKEHKYLVTFVSFNGIETKVRYPRTPVKEIPPLTFMDYAPTGSTPLLDTIGRFINEAEEDTGPVIFNIMTDGEENASKEWTQKRLSDKVEERQTAGWAFIFAAPLHAIEAYLHDLKLDSSNSIAMDEAMLHSGEYVKSFSAATQNYARGRGVFNSNLVPKP